MKGFWYHCTLWLASKGQQNSLLLFTNDSVDRQKQQRQAVRFTVSSPAHACHDALLSQTPLSNQKFCKMLLPLFAILLCPQQSAVKREPSACWSLAWTWRCDRRTRGPCPAGRPGDLPGSCLVQGQRGGSPPLPEIEGKFPLIGSTKSTCIEYGSFHITVVVWCVCVHEYIVCVSPFPTCKHITF